jgi:transcriptional regulator with XRE-family HTH domain
VPAHSYGELLRSFRATRKKSLEAVAKIAGINLSYLSRIERGMRALPSLAVRNSIAAALNLTEEENRLLEISNQQIKMERGTAQRQGEVMVLIMNIKDAKKLIQLDAGGRATFCALQEKGHAM